LFPVHLCFPLRLNLKLIIDIFSNTHFFKVSNPPYIPACDMPGLMDGVRLFEDHGALCGGGDGLDVVRQLLEEAPALLVPTAAAAAAAATTVEAAAVGGGGGGGGAGSCSGSAISDGSSSTESSSSATGLLSGFEDIGNVWLEVDSSHPETLRAMFPPPSLASSCKPLPSLAPASSFASTTCVASTVSLALPAATPEEPKSAISTTKSLQPAVQPAGGLNCSAADPDGKGVFWVSSHLDFGGVPRFCVLGTSRPPLAE
jgi:hypothetical protein